MMNRKLSAALVAALSAAAIGSADAAQSDRNDALAISTAVISLTRAVTAAEQHVGGKASRAEYELDDGQWIYEVEVVRDGTVMDVKVDAASGKVLVATEDATEHDDEDGHED